VGTALATAVPIAQVFTNAYPTNAVVPSPAYLIALVVSVQDEQINLVASLDT